MRKRYCLIVLLGFVVLQTANAKDNYVDLEYYRTSTYNEVPVGPVKSLIQENWDAFKSSVNESFVADNISSDLFWNTLRRSVTDGTLSNRLAEYQTTNGQTGGDIFLSTMYATVKQVPVTYRSVSPRGDSLTLSGKLFLPKNKRAKHIIIANHYTICSNREAPSNASSIEGIFATKDYIVLMPDYIGYGISDSLTHPYLHIKSTVSSAIDLLKAAIPYLQANGYKYYPSLILIGYSQGGAATLALQRELEKNYADKYPIYQVFAGAGPYDLAGTFDYFISNDTVHIPCALPMLVLGLNYGENLGLKREDFFQPLLMEKSYLIETKMHYMNDVNAELGTQFNALLKPIIRKKNSYPTSVLYRATKRNSVLHWTPRASLFMFHSTQDDMVPFLNSKRLSKEFERQGLENVEYDFGEYGTHMNGAVTFFEKVYKRL